MSADLQSRDRSIRSMAEQARRLGPPADEPVTLLRFVRMRFLDASRSEIERHLAETVGIRPQSSVQPAPPRARSWRGAAR